MRKYFIWRLIALFLFAGFIQAKEVRQSLSLDPAPQLEPGKAKLVDLASLPPPLRRVIEDDVHRLRAHHGVLDKEMPADEAQELDTLAQRLLPLAEIAGKTKTPLADVSASALAGYALAGVLPDGPAREGPWSSLRRVFRRPDGVLVMLHEWDYVADGGGVLGVRELMIAAVGPYPAQLAVRRGPAGQVLTELRWITKSKVFTLGVGEDVPARDHGEPGGAASGRTGNLARDGPGGTAYGKAWLLGMARAIR